MAAQEMLDCTQMEAKGPQSVQPVPNVLCDQQPGLAKGPESVQRELNVLCDQHPGHVYTMFCAKHDQVCCVVCSQVKHKSCGVSYLLPFTEGALQSPGLTKVKLSVKDVQKNLETMKDKRKMDMQRLTSEKERELNKIQKTVKEMIKDLEALEKAATDEICRKFSEIKTKIDSDLNQLDMMINGINTKLDKLEKASDEADSFVQMKLLEDIDIRSKSLIKRFKEQTERNIEYKIDRGIEESVRKLGSLGELVANHLYTVTSNEQYDVNTGKDKTLCDVGDICRVTDDSLLITDRANTCLKKLDKTFEVVGRLDFDDKPWGVCSISATQAAVTLTSTRRVHLVKVDSTMAVSSSFKATDCCRGIAYHENKLFIACQGHIALYTVTGTLIRKLEKDKQGRLFFSVPLGVAVGHGGTILACDMDIGVIALDQEGQRLWSLKCKELGVKSVNRLCLDSDGQVVVSSYNSNKIGLILVNEGKVRLRDVLTAKDRISNLQGLFVDPQHNRLLVGMLRNNHISVFNLA